MRHICCTHRLWLRELWGHLPFAQAAAALAKRRKETQNPFSTGGQECRTSMHRQIVSGLQLVSARARTHNIRAGRHVLSRDVRAAVRQLGALH